jgi:predicted dehydrogenase
MEMPLAEGAGTPMNSSGPQVLVIGAGRIAGGFDAPGLEKVLTHAHAWKRLGANLAFVDPSEQNLSECAARWNARGYADLDAALRERDWDVVVLASPDETHLPVAAALADHPWKTLVLEKPPTPSRGEWNRLQEILRPRHDDIAVNFTRRWAPGLAALRSEIQSGKWGEFLLGHGLYGNGLVHNGSHMTDLLTWLLGPMEALSVSDIVMDRPGDPSAGFGLRTARGRTVDVGAVPCGAFTVFELDLVFERGRLRLTESTNRLEEFRVAPSREHAGYMVLEGSQPVTLGLESALQELSNEAWRHATTGAPLRATLTDIQSGFETCLRLAEMRDAKG